jgi:Predicted deacylase
LTSAQIYNELLTISDKYPNLAKLNTAQELFDLASAGTSHDCTFYDHPVVTSSSSSSSSFGCPNFILTIHDTIAHPPGSESDRSLPEVFLSGALHGNERVGPTAVLQTAKLLLAAAQCESLPRYYHPPEDVNTEEGADWILEVQQGEECRKDLLADYGITDEQRRWLARLVSTRRIVIVPMTNALGYDRNERTEDGVDPNRDFPYDVQKPQKCMQTIAGRTVNELFQRHLFQMCLTFHAGTEVIGYEWGAYPYLPTSISPDDTAQRQISEAYSSFAGGFDGTDVYRTGTMNELVYAVKGGMEDWAYAGSWDTDKMIPCEPTQYGGYDKNRTVYNGSTLRAFNMLIETSNDKIPKDHLGSSREILSSESNYEYNGHVSRNVRLALTAIELVQPYVVIWGANRVPLKNDVIPTMDRSGRTCRTSKIMKIPQGRNDTTIAWYVGGGFTVDYTTIMYAKWDNVPDKMNCEHQPLDSEIGRSFRMVQATTGSTRWKRDWVKEADAVYQGQPMFVATIDTSMYEPGDQIAVYATAKLDQGWNYVPDGAKPNNIPPMSHIVNARTNENWRHENVGKIIQGRQDWYSIPLTLVISDDPGDVNTTDLSDRFIISDLDFDRPHTLDGRSDDDIGWKDSISNTKPTKGKSPGILLIGVISACCVVGLYKVRNWSQRRRYRRERIQSEEDDDAFVNEFRIHDLELREFS